jgi:hypothetical protein
MAVLAADLGVIRTGAHVANLTDYTIDPAGVDWPDLLSSWAWLLPKDVAVWIVNRFGDLFLTFDDRSVHMLNIGEGSLTRLATDREQFASVIDRGNRANDWLMIPLVDRLVTAGLTLRPDECYSYIQLPILGGTYTVDNMRVVPLAHPYKAFGPIHEKLKDLPDGTRIKFDVAG